MKVCEIVNRATQDLTVIDLRTQDDLPVNFNSGIHQALHLRGDVGALLVDAEQVSPRVQIRRMY